MKTSWDFVEKYYPNYSSCNDIAQSNDLDMIVNEFDGIQDDSSAMKLYKAIREEVRIYWGKSLDDDDLHNETVKEAEIQLNALQATIYEKAIQGFIDNPTNEADDIANLQEYIVKLESTLKEALDQLESWNHESEPTFTMRRIKELINP